MRYFFDLNKPSIPFGGLRPNFKIETISKDALCAKFKIETLKRRF
tara:strand:+ start:381 stop:515 length:135 start_codon:yes stop_codon:yes gene_type:complete